MAARDDYNAYLAQGRAGERRAVAKAGGKPRKRKPKKPRAPKRPSVLDDPGYVTRPRTMRDLNRDASIGADLRYGEQERAVQLQKQQIPAWFAQYIGQVEGFKQGAQQGYDRAVGEVTARTAATQAAGDGARGQQQQAAQRDAASRGANVDPSVFADDAKAANVRRQGQDAFANLLTAQGRATNDYFGGVQAGAAGQQLAAQTRNADLIRSIAGDKGLYRQQLVGEGRDAERKYGLERAAFNLDVAQEQNDQVNAARQRRTTTQNQRAQRKASSRAERNRVITSGPYAGLTNGQVRGLSDSEKAKRQRQYDKKGGKAGGLTPAQRRSEAEKKSKRNERIQDVIGRWELYKNKKYDFGTDDKPDVRTPTPSELKAKLIKEGFSTVEIHKALVRRKRMMDRKKKKAAPKPKTTPLLNPFD